MSKFYEVQPLDTLFFRGSIPMESGLMNTVSMFPPPESVIKGAFWTASCIQKSQPFGNGNIPFSVEGLFIKKQNQIYLPCPATWYYDSDKKVTSGKELKNLSLLVAEKIDSDISKKLNIQTSAGDVVFVKPKKDAKSLIGCWTSLDFLTSFGRKFNETDILMPKDIYSTESRTGVALDKNRKAIDGQLYSSSHIRLNEDITIVIRFDDRIDLKEDGTVLLGGEKRISKYKKIKNFETDVCNDSSPRFVSVLPVEATEDNLKILIASSKLTLTAGWDMAKGFHKPSTSWIPAGAVFNKNINNMCIPFAHKGE